MVALTIGMATYNDFDGVYFTIQTLRLYHDLTDTELLVIDNYGCEHTRTYVENSSGARYILARDVTGTAAPRDLVFREAQGEAVLCCDSHVQFVPGAIARLKAYYRNNPATRDLLQGPLLYDDLQNIATHFEPVWSDEMWGTWATDPRGLDPDGEAFDIPMQGLGVFSCRKDVWPGFNPAFEGFGGEEGYIHEKFRQAGGRTLCLPWLRWGHRFGRPNGVPYPLFSEHKLRNYIIGHTELGLDTSPIVEHFSHYLTPDVLRAQVTFALGRIGMPVPTALFQEDPLTSSAPAVTFTSEDTVTELSDLTEFPLVSCVCPTYNRVPDRQWLVEEAIESFLRQDYPNKELIILNDCGEQELVCDAPGVRVFNAPERFDSLGEKRNLLVHLADGEFIAPWDDDDISLSTRLSTSVTRIGKADYFNPRRFWYLDAIGLHHNHAMGNGHYASLFRKSLWEQVEGYPPITLGEDAEMDRRFLQHAAQARVPEGGYAELNLSDWYYIYRWGVSDVHLSSSTDEGFYAKIGELPIVPGIFELVPAWRTDYDSLVTAQFLTANG